MPRAWPQNSQTVAKGRCSHPTKPPSSNTRHDAPLTIPMACRCHRPKERPATIPTADTTEPHRKDAEPTPFVAPPRKSASNVNSTGLTPLAPVESPSSEPVQRCPHFPFLSSSAPQRLCARFLLHGFGSDTVADQDPSDSAQWWPQPRCGWFARWDQTQGCPRSSANPGLGVSTPLALAGQEPNGVKDPSAPSAFSASRRETTL